MPAARLRRLAGATVFALTACASFAGCYETIIDPDAPKVAASPLVSVVCDALARCCFLNGEIFTDIDACRTSFNVSDASAAPGPHRAACEALIRARHASDQLCTLGTVENGEDVCAGVFAGPVGVPGKAPGDACSYDEQCGPRESNRCAAWDDVFDAPTTCLAIRRGTPGQGPCVGTRLALETKLVGPGEHPAPADHVGFLCHAADDLFCDPDTLRCVPTAAPDEPCAIEGGCTASLGRCQFLTDLDPPRCRRWQTAGESCSILLPCAPGLGCIDAVCAEGLGYGRKCARYSECVSGVCESGRCGGGISALGIGTCFR